MLHLITICPSTILSFKTDDINKYKYYLSLIYDQSALLYILRYMCYAKQKDDDDSKFLLLSTKELLITTQKENLTEFNIPVECAFTFVNEIFGDHEKNVFMMVDDIKNKVLQNKLELWITNKI